MADTTTTSGPPQWYQQMLQSFYPGAFSIANRPYQQYQGPQVAGMSSITQNALGSYQNQMYGNQATGAGNDFLAGLIGNSSNPYVDKLASNITQEAGRAFDSHLGQVNDIFSNPNSFGGSRHEGAVGDMSRQFGEGLGAQLGQLRYGAFNDDLNRRMQGAGLAQQMNNSQLSNLAQGAQLGNIPREIQQQQFHQGQTNFNNWNQYPQQQASWLASLFGIGNPGSTSTTSAPNPNGWSQALGGLGLFGSGMGWFK